MTNEAFISHFTLSMRPSLFALRKPFSTCSRPLKSRWPANGTIRCSHSTRLSAITSGIWLAQAARLSMAAFQLGSLATPAIVQPLYTPETFASITPLLLAILQALGFANVGVFYAVQAARSNENECYLTNTVTMAATGLVYCVFPVKPPHVNIPFVSTVFVVALVNASSLLRSKESNTRLMAEPNDGQGVTPIALDAYTFVQIMKFATGAGALVYGFRLVPEFAPPVIGQVYLLQVGLNLIVFAILAARYRVSPILDGVVLAGMCACLTKMSPVLGRLSAIGAAVAGAQVLTRMIADMKRTE